MNKQAHTPGPWKAVCQDVQGNRAVGDDGLRYWQIEQPWEAGAKYRGGVANVFAAPHIDGITIAERDANAHLIAAAPDLLDACDFALSILEALGNGSGDAANACRVAIAKATGAEA